MSDILITQFYRGYRLETSGERVYLYRGPKFVSWAISMAQAVRLIDQMSACTPTKGN